jgi:cytochrome c oxidase subunit 2
MMTFILILGVLLVLVILFMLFRIASLLSVAKGVRPDEVSPNNSVHGVLFMLFMILGLTGFFWYSYTHFDQYTLPVASEHGVVTDRLFWITMGITVAAFVAIFIAMFWFVYRYRYQEGRKAAFYPDNHALEFTWTIIPAVVLALLIFTGLRAWNDITSPASEEAEVIEVVGQQFAWSVRYPGKDGALGKVDFRLIDNFGNEFGLDLTDSRSFDDFKSLELHLPKGKEVLLKIRAKDVIHSVFLPHFRVKMDAVPGMPTHFKFTATKTTREMREETGNPDFNYEMACTEICGRGHFSMRMLVVVHTPEEFERWKNEQETWLKQNPGYMERIPADLREAALIKSGIEPAKGTTVMASGGMD